MPDVLLEPAAHDDAAPAAAPSNGEGKKKLIKKRVVRRVVKKIRRKAEAGDTKQQQQNDNSCNRSTSVESNAGNSITIMSVGASVGTSLENSTATMSTVDSNAISSHHSRGVVVDGELDDHAIEDGGNGDDQLDKQNMPTAAAAKTPKSSDSTTRRRLRKGSIDNPDADGNGPDGSSTHRRRRSSSRGRRDKKESGTSSRSRSSGRHRSKSSSKRTSGRKDSEDKGNDAKVSASAGNTANNNNASSNPSVLGDTSNMQEEKQASTPTSQIDGAGRTSTPAATTKKSSNHTRRTSSSASKTKSRHSRSKSAELSVSSINPFLDETSDHNPTSSPVAASKPVAEEGFAKKKDTKENEQQQPGDPNNANSSPSKPLSSSSSSSSSSPQPPPSPPENRTSSSTRRSSTSRSRSKTRGKSKDSRRAKSRDKSIDSMEEGLDDVRNEDGGEDKQHDKSRSSHSRSKSRSRSKDSRHRSRSKSKTSSNRRHRSKSKTSRPRSRSSDVGAIVPSSQDDANADAEVSSRPKNSMKEKVDEKDMRDAMINKASTAKTAVSEAKKLSNKIRAKLSLSSSSGLSANSASGSDDDLISLDDSVVPSAATPGTKTKKSRQSSKKGGTLRKIRRVKASSSAADQDSVKEAKTEASAESPQTSTKKKKKKSAAAPLMAASMHVTSTTAAQNTDGSAGGEPKNDAKTRPTTLLSQQSKSLHVSTSASMTADKKSKSKKKDTKRNVPERTMQFLRSKSSDDLIRSLDDNTNGESSKGKARPGLKRRHSQKSMRKKKSNDSVTEEDIANAFMINNHEFLDQLNERAKSKSCHQRTFGSSSGNRNNNTTKDAFDDSFRQWQTAHESRTLDNTDSAEKQKGDGDGLSRSSHNPKIPIMVSKQRRPTMQRSKSFTRGGSGNILKSRMSAASAGWQSTHDLGFGKSSLLTSTLAMDPNQQQRPRSFGDFEMLNNSGMNGHNDVFHNAATSIDPWAPPANDAGKSDSQQRFNGSSSNARAQLVDDNGSFNQLHPGGSFGHGMDSDSDDDDEHSFMMEDDHGDDGGWGETRNSRMSANASAATNSRNDENDAKDDESVDVFARGSRRNMFGRSKSNPKLGGWMAANGDPTTQSKLRSFLDGSDVASIRSFDDSYDEMSLFRSPVAKPVKFVANFKKITETVEEPPHKPSPPSSTKKPIDARPIPLGKPMNPKELRELLNISAPAKKKDGNHWASSIFTGNDDNTPAHFRDDFNSNEAVAATSRFALFTRQNSAPLISKSQHGRTKPSLDAFNDAFSSSFANAATATSFTPSSASTHRKSLRTKRNTNSLSQSMHGW